MNQKKKEKENRDWHSLLLNDNRYYMHLNASKILLFHFSLEQNGFNKKKKNRKG